MLHFNIDYCYCPTSFYECYMHVKRKVTYFEERIHMKKDMEEMNQKQQVTEEKIRKQQIIEDKISVKKVIDTSYLRIMLTANDGGLLWQAFTKMTPV